MEQLNKYSPSCCALASFSAISEVIGDCSRQRVVNRSYSGNGSLFDHRGRRPHQPEDDPHH